MLQLLTQLGGQSFVSLDSSEIISVLMSGLASVFFNLSFFFLRLPFGLPHIARTHSIMSSLDEPVAQSPVSPQTSNAKGNRTC